MLTVWRLSFTGSEFHLETNIPAAIRWKSRASGGDIFAKMNGILVKLAMNCCGFRAVILASMA